MGQGGSHYVKMTSFRAKTTKKHTEGKMMKKSLILNTRSEPLIPANSEIIIASGLINYMNQ